ncbi:MAG TPA: TolC family protein [bacterium]|nr:TolC family protein [bacterium]
MKRRSINRSVLIAALAAASFITYGAAAEAPGISLQDAAKMAFRNNKAIQIQEKEIDAARADVELARSDFLPKVNLQTGYTHNDWVPQFGSGPGVEQKKDLGIFMGYKNDMQLGVTAGQTIYNGGSSVAQLNRSRIMFKVQEQTLRACRLDVEFETRRLYYGLLLAFEVERISRDLVVQAQAHYEDVRNRFEQGMSSRFDLLQSKVYVSKQIPVLVKAKNDVDVTMADLKKLLGVKLKDELRVEGTLEHEPLEVNEDGFFKTACEKKPEMVLKLLGIDLGWWNIEMAKSGFRPQIAANGGLNFRSDNVGDMFNSKHSNWNVGVTASVPIFDGWSTKARVDAAQAKYAEAALGKEDVADQTAVDIRRACLDLAKAQSIIDSQRDSVAEAKEALRIAEISYTNGVGTNLDVLDAQTSLSQIEKALCEAIYDYLMAKAFLERTMGVGMFDPPEAAPQAPVVSAAAVPEGAAGEERTAQ